jgi:hypothetical protein
LAKIQGVIGTIEICMTDGGRTSISLKQDTGETLRDLKSASSATSWDEFLTGLVDDSESVQVRMDELETVELEKTEQAKETRAMAVGVLEAVQRTGIKEELLDLIEELRKQEMVEMNKRVVGYIMEKAQNDEPLNEADEALLEMVIEIETSREDGADAATAIAAGLFGDTEESISTTTESVTSTEAEDSMGIFTGIEDADGTLDMD